mmetsp:Transcript_6383/g.7945  ORF Transcript_6383/g.7945 Transcript_6383/m.7945 type:complete len:98 (+) Transcript_6383:51-344(+)
MSAQLSLNINICGGKIDTIINTKTPTNNDGDCVFSGILLNDVIIDVPLSSEMCSDENIQESPKNRFNKNKKFTFNLEDNYNSFCYEKETMNTKNGCR